VSIPPIVGIGASAGGLEALEQFLGNTPAASGLAFVIIQHLDPTHKDILAELLQRSTGMEVVQARNRMKIKADHVYIIPPNKDMTLLRGTLHLLDPVEPRGRRMPIDFFFRALAEDQHDRCIGVILSGMGSDGTLGLRAIKEKAGVVLVQDPATAKFDGMPRSAIDAGLADIVAPVNELPGKIIACLRQAPQGTQSGPVPGGSQSALAKVVILLRVHTGHDFSLYKRGNLYRRIERRMSIHQIRKITDYVRYLRENPQELDLLFKELLIGVTSFFRDPAAWDILKGQVLPALLSGFRSGKVLRAWVPGCSTGEEAYSLAIVFKEVLEEFKPQGRFSLQIFATDLDQDAINRARQAFYPANIVADVSPARLARFFVADENGYRVGKEIREMVIFAPQNIIMDPPFTKLDILACRNLLIYFDQKLQTKLLPLFHYSLNPGGVLFLGSAETIGGFTDLFVPLEGKSRLYRRTEVSLRTTTVEFPTKFFPGVSTMHDEPKVSNPAVNLQLLADQLLLQQFSPPAVLVNEKGDIIYISGRTGKYLEPAAGKANWNIHVMAREGLRHELATALQRVKRDKGTVTCHGVRVGANGGVQSVNLTVQAIEEPESLRGMVMIVFADVAAFPAEKAPAARRGMSRSARVLELEQELQRAREEIQSMRGEMQTSQEELKTANEELQSTNEELQSTNEELTTSKEEMQSLNEELQTVNVELQAKVDDLSRVNNDMINLLNSTDIATVFLDNALHVRRFTTPVTRIIKLIPGDVGRPLSDIVTTLDYPGLQEDALGVLRTLVFSEKQISTGDGRWFMVRIMPYRTLENMIDGVVITFIDITVSKTLEAELRGVRGAMQGSRDGRDS
jgi:chemotaxis methyl-accepting protein methylase